MKKRRAESPESTIAELLPKKEGRPFLLSEHMDMQLQLCLKKVMDQGGVISASVIVAATQGLLLSMDHIQLVEKGGHIKLSRVYVYYLLERMKFMRRKAATAKSKYAPEDSEQLKVSFLDDVVSVVTLEETPPELILN